MDGWRRGVRWAVCAAAVGLWVQCSDERSPAHGQAADGKANGSNGSGEPQSDAAHDTFLLFEAYAVECVFTVLQIALYAHMFLR